MPSQKTRNDLILRTKLHRPQLPPDLVPRARLLELLDQHPGRSFTLVSAPAGYGKSTLVSRWLDGVGEASAWLSLDEDDSDLRSFLKYLIAAVRTHSPKACRRSHEFLGAAELPPPAVLGECLSNDLDAIKRRFVLVIDDYHRIHSSAVHDLVGHILRHPSRTTHLVLVTRHDPPLPLVGLRAGGQSLEIREQDLRFTRAETRTVLETIGGVTIEDRTLAHLHEVLEGWITGLRLVCLMLRHEKDPAGFLDGLHGGTLNTQLYLVEEVLKQLSPGFEDILLKTSILNRLCGPLCDAMGADEEAPGGTAITGEEFLIELERANLFAIRLDARGEWVRYHHLFQQLLQQQLERRASAGEIATLHERASDWFASQGLREEALQHALRAGNVEKAAGLVEAHRMELMNNDTWYVLERWLHHLPDEVREARPHLLLAEAWTAYERFQLERLPALLDRVDTLVGEGPLADEVRGELCFFRGALAYWSGEGEAARGLFEEAQACLPKTCRLFRGLVELLLGLARCMCGDKEGGIKGLENQISDMGGPEGIFTSRLVAGLVFAHHLAGEPMQAHREAQRMRVVARKSGIAYTEAWSEYMDAVSFFCVHRLEDALRCFRVAVRQRYILHTRAAVDALAGMVITQQLLRQDAEATGSMEMLQAFVLELGESQYIALADSCRARLAVLQGDLATAFPWARSAHDAPVPAASFYWLEAPWITQTRVLIAEGSDESLVRATEVLDGFLQQSEACRFVSQVIEAAVLRPLLLEKQGRRGEAMSALREAIDRAAPGGWLRPFVEAGPPMSELLGHLSEAERDSHFVTQIRSALSESKSVTNGASRSALRNTALLEPLTNRELDVLELLARRLQDKEIAEELSVSVGTVKSHLKHIYGKLAAAGRREAVLKAEELGLI